MFKKIPVQLKSQTYNTREEQHIHEKGKKIIRITVTELSQSFNLSDDFQLLVILN